MKRILCECILYKKKKTSLTQLKKMCVIMQWCTIAMRDALCSVFKICTHMLHKSSLCSTVHTCRQLPLLGKRRRRRKIRGDFGSYVQLLIYRRCFYLICFRVAIRGNLRKALAAISNAEFWIILLLLH